MDSTNTLTSVKGYYNLNAKPGFLQDQRGWGQQRPAYVRHPAMQLNNKRILLRALTKVEDKEAEGGLLQGRY